MTVTTAAAERIAPFLTLANARQWEASREQYTFVIYNVLDRADVHSSDRAVDYVEAQFEALLASDIIA